MYEIDQLLKEVKHIHFIGIGGSGMCPLAEILNEKGYIISGSDNNETDTLARVRAMGAKVTLGQVPENIEGAELIIYTSAILAGNPELEAAKNSGIPLFERNDLLGAITRIYPDCIGVCGTHGKTTTCAMLTQVLIECGKDPSAVIGGKLPLTGTSGIVGSSEHMVCESCEYQDHFLKLTPDVAVILNVDEDHLEYFKNLDNLKKSFEKFASFATKKIIYNGDDKNTCDVIESVKVISDKPTVSFGFNKTNDYYADNIELKNEFASFDVIYKDENLGRVTLSIPGEHNIYNALAVFASAVHTGAKPAEIITAIAHFRGAGRRFEILDVIDGITIADDYAHHPRELEVTLNTAMGMGYNNVWAVFQPFTYSRTKILFDDFVRVLKIPDKVVMTEIMGSREVNTYGIYTADLAKEIPGSVWYNTFEEVSQYVVDHAKEGDFVITLGCGDIYKAAKIMIKMLKEKRKEG
ncbi:MAG: UDP-N-acetylmuramate--L-alanine ligase [Clostridia bacterium]|nr:UDP-N-acetylmuramate--L-alanine ligase [Clostridia bacterium]